MARAVLDERDQILVSIDASGPVGRQLFEDLADRLHDLDVLHLSIPADVVGRSNLSFCGHQSERTGVVLDVEPVPDLVTSPVYGEGLSLEGVEDRERYEFFGELAGAVVVRAVRDHHRQPVGPVPCPDEVISTCLARGVGGTWGVWGVFGEAICRVS